MSILKDFNPIVMKARGQTIHWKIKSGLPVLCLMFYSLTTISFHWVTLMPFTSIYSTDPRTNLWNFREKLWELVVLKNSFFLSWPFWNFFFKNRNFDNYPGFQPKTNQRQTCFFCLLNTTTYLRSSLRI